MFGYLFFQSNNCEMSVSVIRDRKRKGKKLGKRLDVRVLLISSVGMEVSRFETKIRSLLSIIFASNFCSFALSAYRWMYDPSS